MVDRTLARRILLVLGLVALCVGVFFGVSYYLSLRIVTVEYQHASNVEIFKTSSLDSGGDQKAYRTIDYSGQDIKIPKGEYTVYYEGSKGYESKYQDFNVDEDRTLIISPGYDVAKLNEILKTETAAIRTAITQKYTSGIDQYEIESGKLYANGSWFGATLKHKVKENIFNENADTLRVVLKKTGAGWAVVTDPPNIYLSKYAYPEVPLYILKDVNAL